MIDGMTDLDGFNCHEECFEAMMDECFPYGWRENPSGEEGEYGGYYDVRYSCGQEWRDSGISYTTWY